MIASLTQRWAKNVSISPNGCWEWIGLRTPKGYGRLPILGKRNVETSAHRYAWEIFFGPIPEGKLICHRCDNPWCVNPEHLFVGSHLDNALDAKAKGRTRNGKEHITHCINGHEFTPENTYQKTFHPPSHKYPTTMRRCRTCNRERALRRYHKLRRLGT